MRKIIIYIIILLQISLNLKAQSTLLQNEVKSLFTKSIQNQNTIELYGYFNECYEVQLYLVNCEEEWKGICYYPSSKTKIKLEGGIVNNNLILDELNDENEKIGMWLIEINNINYQANWMNISKNLKFTINLKKLTKTNKILESTNSLVNTYIGKISNNSYSITTYRNKEVVTKVDLVNIDKAIFIQNKINCTSPDCRLYTATIYNNENIKKIEFKSDGNKKLSAKSINQFGTNFSSIFNKTGTIKLEEKTFINEHYRLNITYPYFKNNKIRSTFNKEIEKIIDSLKYEMQILSAQESNLDNRLDLHIKGWFEIVYFSKDIFSAIFTIQKNYTDKIKSIPIIFSFKTGRKINLYKQFKSNFNTRFYFEQFLKEKSNILIKNSSILLRNHLNYKNFTNTTINSTGIVFSTDFNSIFGVHKIILPYNDIKNKIRKKSIFKKMLQK